MMIQGVRRLLLAGTAIAATTAFGGVGHAQTSLTSKGIAAGTVVENKATATYTVNNNPQSVDSNKATFIVDRKVNFTLVRDQTGSTMVQLGAPVAVTTFRLTNLTNGTQDFRLDPEQLGLPVGVIPGTDNFDIGQIAVYVDANTNGTYEAGVDVKAYVDELLPDESVAIFIVGTIPATNASLAFVALHATAAEGGALNTQGNALVSTDLNLINQNNALDVIFADNDSDDAFVGDIARNGQARAYAAYEVLVSNVDLTVTKSSRVISDDVDGIVAPNSLPGAIVEYCLIVRNATLLTAANTVTLTDNIPVETTYVPGSITIGALGGATECLVSGVSEDDDTDDAGELDPYRGSFDIANNRVTAVIPTLIGGASVAASFRVKIK